MDWSRVRLAVRNILPYILSRDGMSIPQLSAGAAKRVPAGDAAQRRHGDRQVWHRRTAVIESLARELKMGRRHWGPERAHADFYNIADHEIAKLRKAGDLIDWNARSRSGIFRLEDARWTSQKIGMSNGDAESAAPELAPNGGGGGDPLKEAFISIITRGNKANTYKFALARALLEYCSSATPHRSTGRSDGYDVPYEYLADRFLKYYWHQECKFRIKQDFQPKKNPNVVHAIRKVFGDQTYTSFDKVPEADKERARQHILQKVFGHARSKTSMVVPRFQRVRVGGYALENRVFYDYDDDEKVVRLRPEAFEFFRNNNKILSMAVLSEWAKFLERINGSLPRLVAKIEQSDVKRTSLAKFREAYLDARMSHCFYCRAGLEPDYTHVDHFLPWSYIFEDEAWNLVLACQDCNLKKSDSLPESGLQDDLIRRNHKYRGRIGMLDHSIRIIDTGRGWRQEIREHYGTCLRYGFRTVRLP